MSRLTAGSAGRTMIRSEARGRGSGGALLILLLIALLTSAAKAITPALPLDWRADAPREPLERALWWAGLNSQDLAFPLLPVEPDSFRLARVDQILKNGARLDLWADSLAARAGRLERLADLHALLQAELTRSGHAATLLAKSPAAPGGSRTWQEWVDQLSRLGTRRLLDAAAVEVLEHDLGDLMQEDPDQTERSVFELDSLLRLAETEAQARRDRLQAVALPDPRQISDLLGEIDEIFFALNYLKAAAAGERPEHHPLFGDVLYADEYLIIGDLGPNTYRGNLPPVIIDLGGDDHYQGSVAVSRGGVGLVIDLSGDDTYRAVDEIGPAATVGGLSLLLDLAGDDIYRGDFASLGAALGGVAMLIDQQGDDRYFSDTFGLGAGGMGIGALLDGGGHDLYQSCLYGQGFGYVAGLGLLQDQDGNDQYLMQPRYVDQIRYEDHHVTMGQGFGFGSRPDISGGIGLLHDLAGNDLYNADIFGQGGAYWWALGALVDRAGNDRYLAWQYAQGSGVHLAAALLLDDAGMDVYQSKGVSQGCGHDLALGWLLDRHGDDSYTAWDLSQGAGSANGSGLLTDLEGEDLYAMRSQAKPRAYGDPRRRTGSIGLFLDAAGTDFYLGGGANDSLWHGSLRGFGQDWGPRLHGALPPDDGKDSAAPGEAASGEAAGAPPLDPVFRQEDSADRLYVWAIRLEPKWVRERDLARAALKARPADLAALIRERRLMASEISWERHALRELVGNMGQEALPLLVEVMERPVPEEAGPERKARRTERGFALWVFSEMPMLGGADMFQDWWRASLAADESGPQSLLLECLALRQAAPDPLLAGMKSRHATVRRSAAWGLGRLPATEPGRDALLQALGDSILAVRISAFESLAADTLLGAARLEAALALAEPGRRREIVRLLARRDPVACRRLLPSLEKDAVLLPELEWIRDGLPPAPAPARRTAR